MIKLTELLSNGVKVYLDDERPVPNGWILVKTAQEAIDYLINNEVEVISLDHDLGDENIVGTGYDVVKWIEEQVYTTDYKAPEIRIHTANSSARVKMELGVKSILRKTH